MREIITDANPIEMINKDNHSLPFIISIPHSGTFLTKEFVGNLEDNVILANTDWYLDELYNFLKDLGFTVIINKISRYVIDPNRELKESLDDSFFHNAIYPKTTYGKKLYKQELSKKEKDKRIKDYYLKHHNAIKEALKEKKKYFEKVYVIDLHSFGSPIPYDVILGNNYFKSASKEFSNLIKELFENMNFKVDYNNHFSGGYITKYYGNINDCETIQIELSYKKYIANREFREEEFPKIDEYLYLKTRKDLESIFKNLRDKFEKL